MTTLADVDAAMRAATDEVFRLEGRQLYEDDPAWKLHQGGFDWTADPDLDDWCALLDTVTARAPWRRVRLVVEPWTDYTRFEIEAQYPVSLRHGEQIGLVQVERPSLAPDFWLIDGRAFVLRYDDGWLTSVTRVTDEPKLTRLRWWRDEALARAQWLAVPASV